MGKFNKNGSKEVPELNTSSLPDLIFSILFFFMMVTSMREVTLKVEFNTPKGTEIEKLEKNPARFLPAEAPAMSPAVDIDLDEGMDKVRE